MFLTPCHRFLPLPHPETTTASDPLATHRGGTGRSRHEVRTAESLFEAVHAQEERGTAGRETRSIESPGMGGLGWVGWLRPVCKDQRKEDGWTMGRMDV